MERDVTTEDLRTGSVVKRWDISGIQNGLVDDNGNETILGRYLRTVEDKLQANWSMDNDIEGNLNALKNELCEGARLELGYDKK